MIDLTSKLGEINDIEHNKGSKIYPQNQVILDCIMPTIPLKHKCLSIILLWVIVSHKKSKKKNFFFFVVIFFFFCCYFFFFLYFSQLENRHGIGYWEKGGYFQNSAPREGQKMPWLMKGDFDFSLVL